MSNKYKDQAQDILIAVGGVENIVDVTSVAENDVQLVIKLNGNVDEVYQQLQRLIKNTNVEKDANTDNINSQDTSYTPQVKVTTPILVKAPIAGRRILLKEVRDSIFREKMVGELGNQSS